MHIVKVKTILEFGEKHADSFAALITCYKILKSSDFRSVDELKNIFPYISVLNDNRVVFNIKGNKYRMIVKFNYSKGRGFIRFIGTHEEYNKIDANTI